MIRVLQEGRRDQQDRGDILEFKAQKANKAPMDRQVYKDLEGTEVLMAPMVRRAQKETKVIQAQQDQQGPKALLGQQDQKGYKAIQVQLAR